MLIFERKMATSHHERDGILQTAYKNIQEAKNMYIPSMLRINEIRREYKLLTLESSNSGGSAFEITCWQT